MNKNALLAALIGDISRDELDIIWDALHNYRDKCIPEGDVTFDDEWGDICHIMAKITEALFGDELEGGAQ